MRLSEMRHKPVRCAGGGRHANAWRCSNWWFVLWQSVMLCRLLPSRRCPKCPPSRECTVVLGSGTPQHLFSCWGLCCARAPKAEESFAMETRVCRRRQHAAFVGAALVSLAAHSHAVARGAGSFGWGCAWRWWCCRVTPAVVHKTQRGARRNAAVSRPRPSAPLS